jgi:hypothetical protein
MGVFLIHSHDFTNPFGLFFDKNDQRIIKSPFLTALFKNISITTNIFSYTIHICGYLH